MSYVIERIRSYTQGIISSGEVSSTNLEGDVQTTAIAPLVDLFHPPDSTEINPKLIWQVRAIQESLENSFPAHRILSVNPDSANASLRRDDGKSLLTAISSYLRGGIAGNLVDLPLKGRSTLEVLTADPPISPLFQRILWTLLNSPGHIVLQQEVQQYSIAQRKTLVGEFRNELGLRPEQFSKIWGAPGESGVFQLHNSEHVFENEHDYLIFYFLYLTFKEFTSQFLPHSKPEVDDQGQSRIRQKYHYDPALLSVVDQDGNVITELTNAEHRLLMLLIFDLPILSSHPSLSFGEILKSLHERDGGRKAKNELQVIGRLKFEIHQLNKKIHGVLGVVDFVRNVRGLGYTLN